MKKVGVFTMVLLACLFLIAQQTHHVSTKKDAYLLGFISNEPQIITKKKYPKLAVYLSLQDTLGNVHIYLPKFSDSIFVIPDSYCRLLLNAKYRYIIFKNKRFYSWVSISDRDLRKTFWNLYFDYAPFSFIDRPDNIPNNGKIKQTRLVHIIHFCDCSDFFKSEIKIDQWKWIKKHIILQDKKRTEVEWIKGYIF